MSTKPGADPKVVIRDGQEREVRHVNERAITERNVLVPAEPVRAHGRPSGGIPNVALRGLESRALAYAGHMEDL